MCGNLIGKLLDNHTLTLSQLLSAAVDVKNVADLIQNLTVAVDPVKVVLSDVDLGTTRRYQPPAELLLHCWSLDPGQVLAEGGDCSFKDSVELIRDSCFVTLENFELWDDLFF